MIKCKKIKNEYKLVRNKIPEIIEQDGTKTALCTVLEDDREYKHELWDKLQEEVNEAALASGDDSMWEDHSENFNEDKLIEELADIYEVYRTIMDVYHIRKSDVIARMLKKDEERGDFSGRVYLFEVLEHEKTND